MKCLFRTAAVVGGFCAAFLLLAVYYMGQTLPDRYRVSEGEEFNISTGENVITKTCLPKTGSVSQALTSTGNTFQAQLDLFGIIPVKQVTVEVVDQKTVAACGSPFGIKMFTEGVMVVGLSDLDTNTGAVNPAKEAGIHIGDVVLSMNGESVRTNEDVARVVVQSEGNPITVCLRRKNQNLTLSLTPRKGGDGGYLAGMWVRDSSAGIGTMTFYDPVTDVFGGLGHAVCDVDTGEILPLMSGEAVQVSITGVVKGEAGTPGELQGDFYERGKLGDLYLNNETGVFGRLNTKVTPPYLVPIAFRQETQVAPATILTTLDGTTPREYDIMIEKVNFTDNNPTKNMVIRITDPRLLNASGGIVQGMSGSPILQNGKLIGAVTHVFVNDPTRGFGIFAENMYFSVNHVENAIKMAS